MIMILKKMFFTISVVFAIFVSNSLTAFMGRRRRRPRPRYRQRTENSRRTRTKRQAPTQKTAPEKEYIPYEIELKTKKLIKTISNAFDSLNKLEEIFSGIEDPQRLIEKLIEKGKIKKWVGAKSTWHNFRNDLNAMRQKLEKIKSKDPNTDKSIYFENIESKDIKGTESLEKFLTHITNAILENIRFIHISDEGEVLKKTLKEDETPPREALTNLMNAIISKINSISKISDYFIDKFEGKKGEATKIKQEKERKKRQAEFSLRRMRYKKGKTAVAGKPEKTSSSTQYNYSSDYEF